MAIVAQLIVRTCRTSWVRVLTQGAAKQPERRAAQ